MSKPDSIIFFRPVCRICTATIPWQHARATSSAKTARHLKNMAANSEPMGRKMKLSPPTTKTQKPQRYLTLLYRHLDVVHLLVNNSLNISFPITRSVRSTKAEQFSQFRNFF
jgi:hypothetical protein